MFYSISILKYFNVFYASTSLDWPEAGRYRTCDNMKTNEPTLLQISARSPRSKEVKLLTLGSEGQRSRSQLDLEAWRRHHFRPFRSPSSFLVNFSCFSKTHCTDCYKYVVEWTWNWIEWNWTTTKPTRLKRSRMMSPPGLWICQRHRVTLNFDLPLIPKADHFIYLTNSAIDQ